MERIKGYSEHFEAVNKWMDTAPEAEISRNEVLYPDGKKKSHL